jgi:hypothetical protein
MMMLLVVVLDVPGSGEDENVCEMCTAVRASRTHEAVATECVAEHCV